MATAYAQKERPMSVATPLGKDALLLVGFSGHEGISQLFSFELELLADNKTDVAFDKLLGQKITLTVNLPKGKKRYINGICHWVLQGGRDDKFTSYRMEIVPQLWLLTKRVQSRIFQHMAVPDILKKVLTGLDVVPEIQGKFEPRDYCVQYRESDYNFAARLMEEEGIYYFFKHADGGHKLVLANTPGSHPDMPETSKFIFERNLGGIRQEERIEEWQKVQELRSGKYTLWDHCFELPHKHLEAEKIIQETAAAGKVTHKLKVANNDKLEIYDYPGAYAQRVDGIDKGGGAKAADVQKIFDDNKRTVGIRMEEEALPSLQIQAAGNCRNLVSGHKFTLERHFNADGPYVVTGIHHSGRVNAGYVSGQTEGFEYRNTFTCIPFALPYRPARKTPRPTVQGSQTAVVVGPGEIAPDKYGRVKVQFHWDREGKNNADSSCWVRVSTMWAGKQWGMVHIPRVGQEVIVDFLEGDPDNPIIVGSVYNADMMPPYALPGNATQSGIKSRSSPGGGEEDFNEICFEDKKGSELLYIRAQKDQHIAVENDEAHWVGRDREKEIDRDEKLLVHHDRNEWTGNDRSLQVDRDKSEKVGRNKTIQVAGEHSEKISKSMDIFVAATLTEVVGINYAETVGGAMELTVGGLMTFTVGGIMAETVGVSKSETIGGSKSETVGGDRSLKVVKNLNETIGQNQTVNIHKDLKEQVKGKYEETVEKEYLLKAKKIQIVAEEEISIKTGKAEVIMKKSGDITINGKKMNLKASGDMILKGSKIAEN